MRGHRLSGQIPWVAGAWFAILSVHGHEDGNITHDEKCIMGLWERACQRKLLLTWDWLVEWKISCSFQAIENVQVDFMYYYFVQSDWKNILKNT